MEKNLCIVCGYINGEWTFKKIISNDLARSWRLTNKLRFKFDLRESQFCIKCGNSARTRIFAKAIINIYPFLKIHNFIEWVKIADKKKIEIAEINSCGKLHRILSKSKNVKYSEYISSNPITRILNFVKNVPFQDITNLTYSDNSFDLLLHSEVLEHIPDYKKAISECKRVLKPDGICLFTVPLIYNRKTYQCAKINKSSGDIIYFKTPSYHGLDKRNDNMVWWEFGGDFIKKNNLKVVFKNEDLITYVLALRKE